MTRPITQEGRNHPPRRGYFLSSAPRRAGNAPGLFFLHCLASSPLSGTNGRLARWGNSRPPISPPRARSVIQGAVENGCALAFSAGALVNFPAHVGTITLCSQSGLSSRLQRTTMPKEHGEWRRRAPDQGRGSSVCRPPQPCGRHLIRGGYQIDRFRYLLRQTVQQVTAAVGIGIPRSF